MEQKQDNRYNNLSSYADQVHEKTKKRIKYSGIVLILLPVVLGLIRWMTHSDKIFFLVIWILCMFAISAYLVSIEYYDHAIHRIASGGEADGANVPKDAVEATEADVEEDAAETVTEAAPEAASEAAEEGGDE